MRTKLWVLLWTWALVAQAQAQGADSDYVTALRQQRAELEDKLAQAYVTITKLQREIDRIRAEEERRVQGLQLQPNTAPK